MLTGLRRDSSFFSGTFGAERGFDRTLAKTEGPTELAQLVIVSHRTLTNPEDEKARVCGICTYCGEVIREGSTGPQPFKVLFREFDDLTYCRGVWWIRAHGGVYYQRCYWWDVESLQLDTKNIRTKQCLRCVEEEKVLDGVHGHMCLAHTE